jgi:molybdopterin molybdotransferase
MSELLTLEAAVEAVLVRTNPLPAERVPVVLAAGRVLAEPACAAVDLPPFPSSAMDGYALRAESTPGRLPVVGRVAAGRPAEEPLSAGAAVAIATGGVVPDGADAVVPIEDVVERDGIVEIGTAVEHGAHVRPRGGDVVAGTEVLPAGTRVGPAQVGALAAAGIAEIASARRPRVAVVTTGTELRPPGASLEPGEIYESNGAMLAAMTASVGAEVVEGPVSVADDEDAHRAAIEQGLDCDVLVTSGGVSVGPHDLVREIERQLGVEEIFWGVAVKPGKPVSFGTRGATLVFGLPGNPVSSLVACQLFVLPALRALQGASTPGPAFEAGLLQREVKRDPRRDALLRAVSSVSEEGVSLTPVEGQESHMIVRASAADALVLVPRGEGALAAGAPVRYLRI